MSDIVIKKKGRFVSVNSSDLTGSSREWMDPGLEPLSRERARLLNDAFQHVKHQLTSTRWEWQRYAALYDNVRFTNRNRRIIGMIKEKSTDKATLTFNVIKRNVDSLVSRLIRNKTRVRFLTSNAADRVGRKAQGMTQYVDAVVHEQRWNQKRNVVLMDGCLLGTGCVKVWPDKTQKKVRIDPVPLDEVYVPDSAGLEKKPRVCFQWKPASRREMLNIYGADARAKAAISKAMPTSLDGELEADCIYVLEAWYHDHNDRSNEAGRHCIMVDDTLLLDEPWPRPIPILFYRYSQTSRGFYGTGVAKDLFQHQRTINAYVKALSMAIYNFGFPKVYVQQGSFSSREAFTNEQGQIVWYTGRPPEVAAPTRVTCQEVSNWITQLVQDSYEQIGLSQFSATGTTPNQLESGVAIREHNDVQNDRFAAHAQSWNEFNVDISTAVVDAAKELGNHKATLHTDEGPMEKIDWSEIDLEREAYYLRAYSANQLPLQPAARMQTLMDWLNAGVFTKEDVMQMAPGEMDVDKLMSANTSRLRAAQRQVENVMMLGDFELPDEFMDAQLCQKIAAENYNLLMSHQDPNKKVLAALKEYMRAVADIISPPQPTQQPQLTGQGEPLALPEQGQEQLLQGPPQPTLPGETR